MDCHGLVLTLGLVIGWQFWESYARSLRLWQRRRRQKMRRRCSSLIRSIVQRGTFGVRVVFPTASAIDTDALDSVLIQANKRRRQKKTGDLFESLSHLPLPATRVSPLSAAQSSPADPDSMHKALRRTGRIVSTTRRTCASSCEPHC